MIHIVLLIFLLHSFAFSFLFSIILAYILIFLLFISLIFLTQFLHFYFLNHLLYLMIHINYFQFFYPIMSDLIFHFMTHQLYKLHLTNLIFIPLKNLMIFRIYFGQLVGKLSLPNPTKLSSRILRYLKWHEWVII